MGDSYFSLLFVRLHYEQFEIEALKCCRLILMANNTQDYSFVQEIIKLAINAATLGVWSAFNIQDSFYSSVQLFPEFSDLCLNITIGLQLPSLLRVIKRSLLSHLSRRISRITSFLYLQLLMVSSDVKYHIPSG